MGNKSGKTEITGPAKVMLEKHGEAALEGLKYWCKLGFPEMGSFSLKRLQELERRLLESEMKKKSSKLCWCAFYLWEREGKDRKKNQPGTESVESVGIFNLNVTRDIDPDLDCTRSAGAVQVRVYISGEIEIKIFLHSLRSLSLADFFFSLFPSNEMHTNIIKTSTTVLS